MVDTGVLDAPAADRLRAHYHLDELGSAASRTLLAFAVMGAGLVGAGIALLVAHNWDDMSRPQRAGLCFALLVLAQSACIFALARVRVERHTGATRPLRTEAWREAAAVFLTASFGASLALVSQTYHAQGELGDFLLAWIVPMIPVVYVLDARVSAGLLVLLALGLPRGRDHAIDEGYLFHFVLASILPLVVRARRVHPGERRTSALEIAFAASASIGGALLVARDAPSVLALALSLAFVGAYLAGYGAARGVLPDLATLALGVTSLAFTFESVVDELYRALRGWGPADTAYTVVAMLGTALVGFVLFRAPAERRRDELPYAVVLVPAWLVFGLGLADGSPAIGALLFDVYVFGLGLERLYTGIAIGHRKRSNFGLLVLSGLFLVRFFDEELSFVVRGLGMMGVGAAFLVMNAYLGRRDMEGAR